MSFEIKYDRDGKVIVPKEAPAFEEPIIAAPVDIAENQPTSLESLAENQPSESQSPEESESKSEISAQPPQNIPEKNTSPRESWKILREKALAAEKRSQELEAALLQAQAQKQQPEEEEEEEVSVDEDALVEGKHLSKVNKHIKKLEQQLQQYQQQTAVNATEMRLKNQYPDFDTVVSKDNLDSLRLAYPEIAQTLNSSTDLYSKAVSAYTMIKKLGINVEDSYMAEKAHIQKNASKPKPLASISPQQGDSPLSKVNAFATDGKLTPELRAQMLKEMNEFRNR